MTRIVCLLFLTTLSCAFMMAGLSKEEKLAYRLMRKFSATLKNKDLTLSGEGLADDKEHKGQLKHLTLCLDTDQLLNINSARKLAIETVEQFLSFLNKDEQLKPYFATYPLTPKQVVVDIGTTAPKSTDPQFVQSVCASGGTIRYYSSDMTPPNFGRIHKETFEEAVEILKKQTP